MSDQIHHVTCEELMSRHLCQHCNKGFVQKASLTRHINEGACKVLNPVANGARRRPTLKKMLPSPKEPDLLFQITNDPAIQQWLSAEVERRFKDHVLSHSVLNTNILCLGSNMDKDMKQVKDCRILEKAYFPPLQNPALMYVNKSKTQYSYYNTMTIGKKLDMSLIITYLKSIDLIAKNRTFEDISKVIDMPIKRYQQYAFTPMEFSKI